jgi:hypothetical protein
MYQQMPIPDYILIGDALPQLGDHIPETDETVEKVRGNAAGGPYEDVLRGSFPLFYLALYSIIAFTHAFVPSRATRFWRRVALRQEPHQPFQILGGRGQQELFGDIPQST